MASTNNFYRSDLNSIHNLVQSSMIVYPKELILAVLKDFFAKDSFYRYVKDEFGFAKTVSQKDLELEDGLINTKTTRLFIGENYRKDVIFYPAILIKSNGMKYTPISFNRNEGTIQYKKVIYDDGYGHQVEVTKPAAFVTAGAWEGSLTIDIYSRSLRACDDLSELVGMALTEIYFNVLSDAGVLVKPVSIGGSNTQEDRNDKLFKQSINLDIRTEYRREIPIYNLIEAINFVIEFDDLSSGESSPATDLTINYKIE
jgi:hypothetical protein